jgi:LPS export ABC transporter protein LptC
VKKLVQLIIFLILLILITTFYLEYFSVVEKKDETKKLTSYQQEEIPLQNNIIKNLKYEILINRNNQYKIYSEKSEITYVKGVEVVLMKNVKAILTNEENNSIFIGASKAIYNNENYNTNFENNVQIEYLDNLITSEKMILDFGENSISIINKVKFEGPKGTLEADNIKINLITKKIEIFMNENNKNILIKSTK